MIKLASVLSIGMVLAFLQVAYAADHPAPPGEPQAPGAMRPLPGRTDDGRLPPPLEQRTREAIARGLKFLQSQQQADGGWTERFGPAITAIAAQAFVQSPEYGPSHPVVRRATAHVLSFKQPDGGIFQPEMNLANYQTSVALMLLSSLKDEKQQPVIEAARSYLQRLQFDENESVDQSNPWYGGAGYTASKRPDLSNTQMMLEALHQSGLPSNDPTYQKALRFISRCQMLGESNDQPFARGATDGGFIYSPANQGESKAGIDRVADRDRLRSYGSMTYAGFKSLLHAGVDRKDPRVRAAIDWIGRNWTLDVNPNMPGKESRQGLYYYLHVFARAMHAWGEGVIRDERGAPHAWRVELCQKLIGLQNRDGSWINEADRWQEGDSNYVTALAVLSMQEALR